MAQLLASGLPEGDTPTVTVDTDEPPVVEAATTPAAKVDEPTPTAAPAAAPEPTPAPVLLAKDGIHTIPFEKLEEARSAAQAAKDEAAAAKAEAETLKRALATATAAPAATPQPTAAPAAPAEVDFGDFSDDSLKKGISQLAAATAAQAVAAAVAPLQAELESLRGKLGEADKAKEVDATTAHFTAIYTAHPDLDSVVESVQLDAWIKGHPTFLQPALRQTLEQGTAGEVIELVNTFKASGKTQPAPAVPDATAEAQAAAAIAAAKGKPPSSLSEVPAGAQAHVDPNAALLNATPQQLMARMADMSPADIEALVSRAF